MAENQCIAPQTGLEEDAREEGLDRRYLAQHSVPADSAARLRRESGARQGETFLADFHYGLAAEILQSRLALPNRCHFEAHNSGGSVAWQLLSPPEQQLLAASAAAFGVGRAFSADCAVPRGGRSGSAVHRGRREPCARLRLAPCAFPESNESKQGCASFPLALAPCRHASRTWRRKGQLLVFWATSCLEWELLDIKHLREGAIKHLPAAPSHVLHQTGQRTSVAPAAPPGPVTSGPCARIGQIPRRPATSRVPVARDPALWQLEDLLHAVSRGHQRFSCHCLVWKLRNTVICHRVLVRAGPSAAMNSCTPFQELAWSTAPSKVGLASCLQISRLFGPRGNNSLQDRSAAVRTWRLAGCSLTSACSECIDQPLLFHMPAHQRPKSARSLQPCTVDLYESLAPGPALRPGMSGCAAFARPFGTARKSLLTMTQITAGPRAFCKDRLEALGLLKAFRARGACHGTKGVQSVGSRKDLEFISFAMLVFRDLRAVHMASFENLRTGQTRKFTSCAMASFEDLKTGQPRMFSSRAMASFENLRTGQPRKFTSCAMASFEDLKTGQPRMFSSRAMASFENLRTGQTRKFTSCAMASFEDLKTGQPRMFSSRGMASFENLRTGQPRKFTSCAMASFEDLKTGQPRMFSSRAVASFENLRFSSRAMASLGAVQPRKFISCTMDSCDDIDLYREDPCRASAIIPCGQACFRLNLVCVRGAEKNSCKCLQTQQRLLAWSALLGLRAVLMPRIPCFLRGIDFAPKPDHTSPLPDISDGPLFLACGASHLWKHPPLIVSYATCGLAVILPVVCMRLIAAFCGKNSPFCRLVLSLSQATAFPTSRSAWRRKLCWDLKLKPFCRDPDTTRHRIASSLQRCLLTPGVDLARALQSCLRTSCTDLARALPSCLLTPGEDLARAKRISALQLLGGFHSLRNGKDTAALGARASPDDHKDAALGWVKCPIAAILDERAAREAPMSLMQQVFLRLYRTDKEFSCAQTFKIWLPEHVNVNDAKDFVVNLQRHDVFRSTYFENAGQMMQRVSKNVSAFYPSGSDNVQLQSVACAEEADDVIRQLRQRGFDPWNQRPPLKVMILQMEGNPQLLLVLHVAHIAIDGQAFSSILRSLASFSAKPPNHDESGQKMQVRGVEEDWEGYTRFVQMQTNFLSSEPGAELLQYWRTWDPRSKWLCELRWPSQRKPQPKKPATTSDVKHFTLHFQASKKRTVVLGLFALALCTQTAAESIVVGLPFHGRFRGYADVVGCCAHVLPCWLSLPKPCTFPELLLLVGERCKEVEAHGWVPISEMTYMEDGVLPYHVMLAWEPPGGWQAEQAKSGIRCDFAREDLQIPVDMMLCAYVEKEVVVCRLYFARHLRPDAEDLVRRMLHLSVWAGEDVADLWATAEGVPVRRPPLEQPLIKRSRAFKECGLETDSPLQETRHGNLALPEAHRGQLRCHRAVAGPTSLRSQAGHPADRHDSRRSQTAAEEAFAPVAHLRGTLRHFTWSAAGACAEPGCHIWRALRLVRPGLLPALCPEPRLRAPGSKSLKRDLGRAAGSHPRRLGRLLGFGTL
ncbi:unnamed protein product [Effrenium voratum]|nr:unnamed protein product [Effrenium voratum]